MNCLRIGSCGLTHCGTRHYSTPTPAVPGTTPNGNLSSGAAINCYPTSSGLCINGTVAEFIWEIHGDYYFYGDGDPKMGAIVAVSAGSPASNTTFLVCPSYAPAPGPSSTTSPFAANVHVASAVVFACYFF